MRTQILVANEVKNLIWQGHVKYTIPVSGLPVTGLSSIIHFPTREKKGRHRSEPTSQFVDVMRQAVFTSFAARVASQASVLIFLILVRSYRLPLKCHIPRPIIEYCI